MEFDERPTLLPLWCFFATVQAQFYRQDDKSIA